MKVKNLHLWSLLFFFVTVFGTASAESKKALQDNQRNQDNQPKQQNRSNQQNQKWQYFATPDSTACDFVLSDLKEFVFFQSEARSGNIGFVQDLQNGRSIRLRDYFSNLAYVVHADANRGFVIVNDKRSYFSFDFKTLQISPLEKSMHDAFALRFKSESPNRKYLLFAESLDNNGLIAIRDLDSVLAAIDIQINLPENSTFIEDNLISDNGKTLALQIAEANRESHKKFKTQVWRIGNDPKKKPKVTHVPGRLLYLSADGSLLMTQTGKFDYKLYSIPESGPLRQILLNGLTEMVKKLWDIADPKDEYSMSSDVRIKAVKVSENGRWFIANFEYVVRSSTVVSANGSKKSSGTTAGIVARWDLQSPQSDPWISAPIRNAITIF